MIKPWPGKMEGFLGDLMEYRHWGTMTLCLKLDLEGNFCSLLWLPIDSVRKRREFRRLSVSCQLPLKQWVTSIFVLLKGKGQGMCKCKLNRSTCCNDETNVHSQIKHHHQSLEGSGGLKRACDWKVSIDLGREVKEQRLHLTVEVPLSKTLNPWLLHWRCSVGFRSDCGCTGQLTVWGWSRTFLQKSVYAQWI